MAFENETLHSGNKLGKDEWLTPPEIIKALGEFDLDPCSPIIRPWDTAKNHYVERSSGLILPWECRVWCNPPYSAGLGKWLEKCAMHQNCIALTFARTETQTFFNYVWNQAYAVLFIKGRLCFYGVDGLVHGNAGAPSILIAYDEHNAQMLEKSKIKVTI